MSNVVFTAARRPYTLGMAAERHRQGRFPEDSDPMDGMKQNFFAISQEPVMWLHKAESLREAAEILIRVQRERIEPYEKACDVAEIYANSTGDDVVEFNAEPPDYVPAELLYAFAFENALKGLSISLKRVAIGRQRIANALKTHDLIKVACDCGFALSNEEEAVLGALSEIGTWAGRYPVALHKAGFEQIGHPMITIDRNSLLQYGNKHPVMRECFDRLIKELEMYLPQKPARRSVLVVLPRDDA